MNDDPIPFHPAHNGSMRIPEQDALSNPAFCMTLLASLLLRSGHPTWTFTQEDFDKIAGLVILEGRDEKGNYMLGLGYRSLGRPL